MRKVNVFEPEYGGSSERAGYRWRATRIGEAIGARQMEGTLYELEDGERTWPYHFHHGVEEWLLVVSGSPVLRAPEGERELRSGDVVCFPRGPAGAHQVRGPGTVLILAEVHMPESIEYPDSGKIGVHPPGKVFRGADEVDYWDGE